MDSVQKYTLNVTPSNLGLVSDYTDWGFCGFPQSHQASAGTVPWISPVPLPSLSFPIYYSLIILSFDANIIWAINSVVK
jgi:hypothetical protein